MEEEEEREVEDVTVVELEKRLLKKQQNMVVLDHNTRSEVDGKEAGKCSFFLFSSF